MVAFSAAASASASASADAAAVHPEPLVSALYHSVSQEIQRIV